MPKSKAAKQDGAKSSFVQPGLQPFAMQDRAVDSPIWMLVRMWRGRWHSGHRLIHSVGAIRDDLAQVSHSMRPTVEKTESPSSSSSTNTTRRFRNPQWAKRGSANKNTSSFTRISPNRKSPSDPPLSLLTNNTAKISPTNPHRSDASHLHHATFLTRSTPSAIHTLSRPTQTRLSLT